MLTFLFVLFSYFHPFHVSVADIEYNASNKSVEITVKVFLDDIEIGLKMLSNKKINIIKINQQERDSLLSVYFSKHLSLRFDKQTNSVNYLGSEIEKDALWCYLEVEGVKKFKAVTIKNTVLQEIYDDQVNLVNFKLRGEIKSTKLDANKPSDSIYF